MPEPVKDFRELFGGSQLDPLRDPYAVYRRLRAEVPAILVGLVPDPAYMITRYQDVKACLRDDVRFSSRSNARSIRLVLGRTIIEMDGREHIKHRNLIAPALSPRSLRGDFPALAESIANDLVDSFAADGEVDLVSAFTFTYPLRVFNAILGLPVKDYGEVHRLAADLARIAVDPGAGLTASQALADYFRPVIEQRKVEPADDLLSRLVHAEVEGHQLTDEEITSFLRLLVIAGAETTYHLMGSVLFALLGDEDLLATVKSDPRRLEAAIEEGLRWESPVQTVTREATEDVSIGGCRISAGEQVMLMLGSANRDETVFDDPDRFVLGRRTEDSIAFGFGKHFCAGSRLAYLEAQTGLRVLLERLPGLRVAPGEVHGKDFSVVGLSFRGPDRLPVRFDAA